MSLVRRGLAPLALSVVVTVVLLGLRFGVETTRYFQADVGSVGAYVTAFGSLYSILAAFVIFVVWTQFNDTVTAIAEEAKDLSDIYRYVGYLNDPSASSGFRSAIDSYISEVVNDEWAKMAIGAQSPSANRAFENIYQQTCAVTLDDEKDRPAWTMIIQKFEEISDSRMKRLTLAASRIPVVLKLLLYAVSVGLVAGFFMLGIENDLLAAATTLLTTAVVVMVIDTVLDIDNPFGGEWAITPAPFLAVPSDLAAVDAAFSASPPKPSAAKSDI